MGDRTAIEWTRGDDGTSRPIPGYDGYSVSRDGVMFGPGGRMSPMVAESGHLYILTRQRVGVPGKLFVHRAILMAWVGPPPDGKPFAIHGDDDPSNNTLTNLRWGSRLDNAADRQRNGGYQRGEAAVSAKLTEDEVHELRRRHPGESLRALAGEFGISHTAVRRAVNGATWSHLG